MNDLPRNARYASQFTLHENEIRSTKDYVRNYKRFMQNKPNFPDTQMNVSIYLQTAYENKRDWTIGQNKPNSNPIKPNFTYPQRGETEVRCRFSEVRYLYSAFCFLASVQGPHDRNRLRLQWHFRVQETSQKQDFVFRFGARFVCLCNCFVFRVL